jgi:hypothetical protein
MKSLCWREWVKKNEESWARWFTVGILIITAIIAFQIGRTQNKINEQIEKLQDSVEIYTYTTPTEPQPNSKWFLRVTNVGTLSLYLIKYSINNATTNIDNEVLPAGQGQNAWYSIPLPKPETTSTIVVKIYATDKLGRMWISKTNISYTNNEWETNTHEIQEL